MMWMTLVASALLIAVALAAVMTIAWVVQQRSGNSGWVDTVWTAGLGTVGVAAALAPISGDATSARQVLVAALVGIWALRLGVHIARRTRGISDDPRYADLIRGWGDNARPQMFWLLQKQALVSVPLALSMFLAAHNPTPGLGIRDLLAALLLAVAIGGEALADQQLHRFRRAPDNAGRVCDTGLWRWSRHPNYFFEWLGWLAYPLLAVDPAGAYPWGWLALAGPLCMYWLLAHVSGIPPLEQHMLRSRGNAFRAYQRRTSAFFPWPPAGAAGGPS
jgi:steroid 5-alpha reductase family enzyme